MGDAQVLIKFKGDTGDVKDKTNAVSSGIENLTSKLTLANIAAEAFSYGMRLINSGLDDAISRVDTMNNFPRVMSNLGISAEESAEVIDSLSEKLQGLPTTIDEAAMSVQRLTSKNGDVKKSEQIFLAMNNAILAGGAPAATQAAAIEQLSQAYAKGKPDMMEWRTIMTAMPAQLKQVATAMGYVNADALGEALRSGEITMDDFMNTMVQLNTEGLEGFSNFETQARNATGGISTSVKNMKTAFTRGIAGILTSIDEALEPMGGISGVLKTIGKIGEKAFQKIGDVLKVVIPKLIEVGKWIKQNKKWIVPLTAAVTTFVVTFSTVKKVTSIIKTVKTAFIALNATMAANPIALVVAAIAALVAAFIYLWNNCEGFRNFWIGLWNSIKAVVEPIVNFIKGIFTAIFNVIKKVIDKIMGIVRPIIDFYVDIYTKIYNFFKSFIQKYIEIITNIIKTVMDIVIPIVEWVWNNVLKPVIDFFSDAFTKIWNVITTIFDGIKNTISTVFNWVKDHIISPLITFFSETFNTISSTIQTAFQTAYNFVKGIFETLFEIIKTPFNLIIDAVNTVIRALNNIKIKVPNWVPGIGGKKFGFDIPEIPKLEVGTNYVPDDMMAIIHEGEAVVPKKFNPYANGFDISTLSMMNRTQPVVIVNANFKQNSLGQTVRDIKTFSGGARNDYNYGVGV